MALRYFAAELLNFFEARGEPAAFTAESIALRESLKAIALQPCHGGLSVGTIPTFGGPVTGTGWGIESTGNQLPNPAANRGDRRCR